MSKQAHRKGSILKWEGISTELTIFPKDLSIIWGNDSRYWRVPTEGDGPAELMEVAWLEVSGIAKVEKNKKYRVEFDVAVKPDASVWNRIKVLVMAKAGKRGRYIAREAALSAGFCGKTPNPESDALEIDMGSEDQLHFGLYEVWSLKWKDGLEIKRAKITKILNDDDLRLAKITKNENDDDLPRTKNTKNENDDDLRRAKITENVNDDDLPRTNNTKNDDDLPPSCPTSHQTVSKTDSWVPVEFERGCNQFIIYRSNVQFIGSVTVRPLCSRCKE